MRIRETNVHCVYSREMRMNLFQQYYEKMVYPNAGHAFNNDTGSRYAPEAARDAWVRSPAWFEEYVRDA